MQLLYRIIYSSAFNPLIRFICKYVLGGAVQIPPSGVLRFKIDTGADVALSTNQTCHVTKVIYYKGYQHYEYSALIEKLAANATCMFDVGANIGWMAVLAAKKNPAITVHAFDPSPGPFFYLQENIKINNIRKQVLAYDLALSDIDGTVTFSIAAAPKYTYLKFNSLGGGGHISELRSSNLTMKKEVRTQTLDGFVEQHNIKALDILKLDAENAEHLILKGGLKTIKRFRPIIFTEIFSHDMAELVNSQFVSDNYALYNLEESNPIPINSLLTDLNEGINNVLLVPQEKTYLLG